MPDAAKPPSREARGREGEGGEWSEVGQASHKKRGDRSEHGSDYCGDESPAMPAAFDRCSVSATVLGQPRLKALHRSRRDEPSEVLFE